MFLFIPFIGKQLKEKFVVEVQFFDCFLCLSREYNISSNKIKQSKSITAMRYLFWDKVSQNINSETALLKTESSKFIAYIYEQLTPYWLSVEYQVSREAILLKWGSNPGFSISPYLHICQWYCMPVQQKTRYDVCSLLKVIPERVRYFCANSCKYALYARLNLIFLQIYLAGTTS